MCFEFLVVKFGMVCEVRVGFVFGTFVLDVSFAVCWGARPVG